MSELQKKRALAILAVAATVLQALNLFGVSVGSYAEWINQNMVAASAILASALGLAQSFLPQVGKE